MLAFRVQPRASYGRPMRPLATTLVLCALLGGQTARAQDRPTSGDMSIISGRTMGNGEAVLAAGVGWPGLWAEALFAPSSRFNLGIQAGVLYGSPFMGFATGVGGRVAVPIRFHMYGHNSLDLSIAVTPAFVIGEGAVVGQDGIFADNLGFGVQTEGGMLLGFQPGESVTITLGALAGFGWLDVPDAAGGGQGVVGTFVLVTGIEALMARDTMLFAEVEGGYGAAPNLLFEHQGIVRVSLGLAYLL